MSKIKAGKTRQTQGPRPDAQQVIKIARDRGVPITEDRQLLKTLGQIELYQSPEVYRAVAEIINFVYKADELCPAPAAPAEAQTVDTPEGTVRLDGVDFSGLHPETLADLPIVPPADEDQQD